MNKKELTKLCLNFDDAVSTNPFKDYPDIVVMRHKSNNKWFGLIFYLEDKLYINLKCNPLETSILRDEYSYVTPAWHMNKTHWNKVNVEKADKNVLIAMIAVSYNLTKPKKIKTN